MQQVSLALVVKYLAAAHVPFATRAHALVGANATANAMVLGAVAALRDRVELLEQEVHRLSHGRVDDEVEDSPTARFGAWVERNRDALARYPDQYVAVSLETGVVAASESQDALDGRLGALAPEVRRKLFLAHTSALR